MRQYKKIWAILTLLCFTLTFLPVAAFAKDTTISNQQLAEVSSVYTSDENASEKAADQDKDREANLGIKFNFDGQIGTASHLVYVWFVKDGADVPASSVQAEKSSSLSYNAGDIEGVFSGNVKEGTEYKFSFPNSGKYKVYASLDNPTNTKGESTTAGKIKNVENKLGNESGKWEFEITSVGESDKYKMQLVDDAGLPFGIAQGAELANGGQTTIGAGNNLSTEDYPDYGISGVNKHLATNGVASDDITFKLLDKDGKAVKGATVKLSTSNTNCKVNKSTITTDTLGQFSFTVAIMEESPNTDGFTVYMETGAYEAKLQITASSTSGHDIIFTQMPQAPFSTDDVTAGSRLDALWIAVKDANGNFVKPFSLQPGGKYAEPAFAGVRSYNFGSKFEDVSSNDYKAAWPSNDAEEFVSIVSKPAESDLKNEDIWLCPVGQDAAFQNTLYTKKDMIAGDYTFKISLLNGKSKTVDIKVAEMGEPVKLNIVPKAPVAELGSKTSAEFKLVDANGVSCKALKKGTDVAVNGNGVLESTVNEKDNKVDIYIKNDDKYAGSEFKIIATNDRYNLVGEFTMSINSGNAMLICPTTTATVGVANDITYILMDQGKMMNITIGNLASNIASSYTDASTGKVDYDAMPKGTFRVTGGQTSFVVASKPEGATVNLDARAAGGAITSIASDCYAVGRVESDKPGIVTIRMAIGVEIKQADGSWSPRYYEGTQNILFTDGKSGKNVIMSIGSNEAIINGGKTALDASPIIKDNRTFVPFRALAEAFGAEVAYDESTKAVTAELNGIKVVMTIGSATYTVDGKEKTADVAPYVANGRTMVPVRFAAEAFGSKVTPTYDEKGATADILFTL